jgi:hypothetical protein
MSERYKRAIVGGLKLFLKGCDYAFLDDLLATLCVKDRLRCMKNTILKFKVDARAIHRDKKLQEECSLRPVAMKMSKADAVLLRQLQ